MKKDLEQFKSGETVEKEIIELHKFFEDWFNGDVENNNLRFTATIANDFEIISPRGDFLTKNEIVQAIDSGYNTQKGRKIWVENIKTRLLGDLIVSTYNELQIHEGQKSNRLSTALFSFDPNTPNNCKWHHVHETWYNEQ